MTYINQKNGLEIEWDVVPIRWSNGVPFGGTNSNKIVTYMERTMDDINGFDDLSTHGESNCCGAPVYDDSDICTECKEHCSVEIVCPDCDGTGEMDARDESKINSTTIIEPFHKVKCEKCGGEGVI